MQLFNICCRDPAQEWRITQPSYGDGETDGPEARQVLTQTEQDANQLWVKTETSLQPTACTKIEYYVPEIQQDDELIVLKMNRGRQQNIKKRDC